MEAIQAVNQAAAIPKETQMLLKLREDRFFDKIPPQEVAEIIEKAAQSGGKLAGELKQKYPDMDVRKIAEALGLEVREKELPIDEQFVSVGYFEAPRLIVINRKMHEMDPFYHEEYPWLAAYPWEDIAIAHEMFHYFQEQQAVDFVETYRVPLWKLGPYTHKTPIASLGEIAAMNFAEVLLTLDFYPGYLEMFLAAPYFPKEIANKAAQLLADAKKYEE